MKDKKIALVHDWLIKYGGAERVLQVLGEMYPESPIYTLLFNEQEKDKFNLKNKIISSFLQRWPNFIKKRQKLLLPFFPAAIESLDLSEYDLIISDSNSFAHGVLTPPECIHVCYCHSPTRYLWDWKSEYLEENNIRGLKRIIINLFLNWLRIWDYYSAKRVDLWLANSYNVARRIKKYYGFNAKVVYPPIELSRFKVREVKESYFLILSRIEHYKKIDIAINAFNKLNLPLVIIGEGSQKRKLEKIAKDNIKFLGYEMDEVTKEYLAGARALIFPGEEDFGIVPVEAMASGTPVIAYRAGGVLETMQEKVSGIFFEDATPESLILAVNEFLDNEKNFDAHVIRRSVEKFDKAHFIKGMKDIINSL